MKYYGLWCINTPNILNTLYALTNKMNFIEVYMYNIKLLFSAVMCGTRRAKKQSPIVYYHFV